MKRKFEKQGSSRYSTSVKTCFPSLNFVFIPGVRQEQDIYVRLIDSVTKQVGRDQKRKLFVKNFAIFLLRSLRTRAQKEIL